LYPMRTGNKYRNVWTTGEHGVATFEHHEYMLFRYVNIDLAADNSTGTCAAVDEGSDVEISCPSSAGGSKVVSAIAFVSYGTPTGTCNQDSGDTFKADPRCDATGAATVVQKACFGKSSCTLHATNAQFGGDPCHLQTKRLAVDVTCSSPAQPLPNPSPAAGAPWEPHGAVTLALRAWTVAYPYYEDESAFSSDNEMLDKVWWLCKNTLKVTSLDTTTDSNTRERLPYEADGFITAESRMALQADVAWVVHSFRHNLLNPTWPTEWRQTLPLMAQAEYLHAGTTTLYQAFSESLVSQTQLPCLNQSLQLPDFHTCHRQTGGFGALNEAHLKDIVDWPPESRDGYELQDVNTVIAAYMVGGLRALSRLANATGDPSMAQRLGAQAEASTEALNTRCVDPATQLYRDGPNSTHSAWHATVFPAAFGLLPEARWPAALKFLKTKGMAGSVYAAYWYLKALYHIDSDHGAAALEAMTNCDTNSWCHMLQVGATAVMEAWSRDEKPNLSWSHPWASAPASAMVWGFFGIEPIEPAFRRFTFKPQPGNVSQASITVPTQSGAITASISQASGRFSASVNPPGTTLATVCLPRLGIEDTILSVDGKDVQGYAMRDYVCVDGVGASHSARIIKRGSK